MPRVALASLLLLLVGCDDAHRVTVVVRTDLLAGFEFTRVRVTAEELPAQTHDVDPALSYADGVPVAELVLPTGVHELGVELIDRDGARVLARPVGIDARGEATVTVLFTRDCASVSCPRDGEAANARACLGGGCVDPFCTLETPEYCDVNECVADADCADPSGPACLRPRCLTGACLAVGAAFLCSAEESCHPERGCRPTDDPLRCGPPDDDAVLLLPFDDGTAADALGRNPGRLEGEAGAVDGPLGCGRALAIPEGATAYAVVSDSEDFYLAEGAIDLWFRRDPGPSATAGLMSRDAAGAGNGHFSLWLDQDDEVVVRFQNAAEDEIVACSEPLTRGEWHHVGVNFGPPGLELWIDGVQTTRTGPVTVVEGETSELLTCGGGGTLSLRPADVIDWAIGASGAQATSPGEVSSPLTGGAIDHVRISRARRDFRAP